VDGAERRHNDVRSSNDLVSIDELDRERTVLLHALYGVKQAHTPRGVMLETLDTDLSMDAKVRAAEWLEERGLVRFLAWGKSLVGITTDGIDAVEASLRSVDPPDDDRPPVGFQPST
jgi:hypothetical protein